MCACIPDQATLNFGGLVQQVDLRDDTAKLHAAVRLSDGQIKEMKACRAPSAAKDGAYTWEQGFTPHTRLVLGG